MTKWKLAFWICLTLLIIFSVIGIYSILDQGTTITYMKEGYGDTEQDLKTVISIINETDFSKTEIKKLIETSGDVKEYSLDTISLERVQLIFNQDTLLKIDFQW